MGGQSGERDKENGRGDQKSWSGLDRELEGHGLTRMFLLGEGATSAVYCVKDVKSGKNYACKAGMGVERLEAEYGLLAGLDHPLFPKAAGFFRGKEAGYIVMEYLFGRSLEEYLGRRGHLSHRQVVRIAVELAGGLSALHGGKTRAVYRDLKPANIMLKPDGRVGLMDLGAACGIEQHRICTCGTRQQPCTCVTQQQQSCICVTQQQQPCTCGTRQQCASAWSPGQGRTVSCRAGTPGFSAPEQFEEGWRADVRADVYALGKVLLCMLGICDPVSGRMKEEGRDVRLPESLWAVLEGCLQQDPLFRLPDMKAVIRMLGRCRFGCTGTIRRRRTFKRRISKRRRNLRYDKNIVKSSHQTDIWFDNL